MCKPVIPSLNVDISQFGYITELIMPNRVLSKHYFNFIIRIISFTYFIAATPFPS